MDSINNISQRKIIIHGKNKLEYNYNNNLYDNLSYKNLRYNLEKRREILINFYNSNMNLFIEYSKTMFENSKNLLNSEKHDIFNYNEFK